MCFYVGKHSCIYFHECTKVKMGRGIAYYALQLYKMESYICLACIYSGKYKSSENSESIDIRQKPVKGPIVSGQGSTLDIGIEIGSQLYKFCRIETTSNQKIDRFNEITAWVMPKEVAPTITTWDCYIGSFPLTKSIGRLNLQFFYTKRNGGKVMGHNC